MEKHFSFLVQGLTEKEKKFFFDIDTRKLLLEIIAQMALIGYKFHANVNIKVSFNIISCCLSCKHIAIVNDNFRDV